MEISELSGWAASIITSMIFIPQLFKALRTKETKDISIWMLFLSLIANSLWLLNGALTQNHPLMASGAFIILVSVSLIGFKYWNEKRQ